MFAQVIKGDHRAYHYHEIFKHMDATVIYSAI